MDTNKITDEAWTSFVTVTLLGCLALIGGCALTERTKQIAIEHGLIQKPIGGDNSTSTYWTDK